jgi:2-polyprenyl-3-methyl-5-hydroxy-6-metoxy-1,4-benzoquinol methylase
MRVSDFYEEFGWKEIGENFFDAVLNENLRESAQGYLTKVRTRIFRNLPDKGKYLLDIGCGPIQYIEYEHYSRNFLQRHCVDVSQKALSIAQEKLGSHVVAHNVDFFEFNSELEFDAVCAINCLYHVNLGKQETFVELMIKQMARNGTLIVIYSNPHSPSSVITNFLLNSKRILFSFSRKEIKKNPITFERHPMKFWDRYKDQYNVNLYSWRTFNSKIEKLFFPDNAIGEFLFRILYKLEEKKFWAKFSEYYIVTIKNKKTN